MASRTRKIIIPLLFLLLVLCIDSAGATLYCGRAYKELKQNAGQPYNAVGYLSNGCTAFLIDADHIAAAAHCFVNTTTGAWQTGLHFYPNFHPDRVAADPHHVPRADVVRVVVGSRAGESVLGSGMDWGIAYLDNWQDTAGLNLTPVRLASSLPALGTALVNPAYTRHHFPYDDNDATTWDNMEWDTTNCGWVGSNGGMWAITMQEAPFYDGVHRDIVGCNSRWGAGMIHADCELTNVVNDVVVHNCDTVGGSSGSPIMYETTGGCSPGTWYVIGVGHGGGPADFSQLAPVCTPDTPEHADNVGASVERFRLAPRFASNVAMHRRPDNSMATAVFAVDSDLDQVVYRARSGASPGYAAAFDYWENLGTPAKGKQLTRIAACAADSTGRPQVFVVADDAEIYTRSVQTNGQWSGTWTSVALPGTLTSVADIDTTHDLNNRCQLFVVAENGNAYTLNKTTEDSWGSWSTVASGSYTRITALNYDNELHVALIDSAGQIWRTSLTAGGWAVPAQLGNPSGVASWLDIDMTWDEAARGFMLAIPQGGGNLLWFEPMYGELKWQWHYFETHLWAPGAAAQDAPSMLSITASRWMEDAPGTTSPVVFATDVDGNIYMIEYARVGTAGWVLDWKSFYHETIPY